MFSHERYIAHRIPRMLNLLPLSPQIPQNPCPQILRLQRDPLCIVQPARPILQLFRAGKKACPGRVAGRFVRVWIVCWGGAGAEQFGAGGFGSCIALWCKLSAVDRIALVKIEAVAYEGLLYSFKSGTGGG
jgi:hypothetical protein